MYNVVLYINLCTYFFDGEEKKEDDTMVYS